MIRNRTISLNTAIAIIIICAATSIAFGVSAVYANYWGQDENTHLDLGGTYYRQGNTDRALSEYKRALRINKNNIQAMYNLGVQYRDALRFVPDLKIARDGLKRLDINNRK